MDIESLRLFSDIRKFGTITAAASHGYITQSSVSKRIAQLEKELGITLFQRGKGQSQVVLTPAGEAFSDIAERILLLGQQAMELQRSEGSQLLTLACINSVQGYTLPPLILALKQQHPRLRFTLEDHHAAEIVSLLENRRVDIGISQAPAAFSDLQSALLYQESYRVVQKYSGTGRVAGDVVHPASLAPEHEIFEAFGAELERWHNRWWPSGSTKIRVNTTPTAQQYFHAPEDWMIVPASVALALEKQGFLSFALGGDPPVRSVFVLYGKHTGNPAVKLFVDAARTYYATCFQPC